jgi:hypothetical protein
MNQKTSGIVCQLSSWKATRQVVYALRRLCLLQIATDDEIAQARLHGAR